MPLKLEVGVIRQRIAFRTLLDQRVEEIDSRRRIQGTGDRLPSNARGACNKISVRNRGVRTCDAESG